MALHIDHLKIGGFRGICGLDLDNLNHVNVIAGDNNSGKTSMLEAVLLLRNPKDFNNILRVGRLRDLGASNASIYENFLSLFPPKNSHMEISVDGNCMNRKVALRLSGELSTIMLAPEDLYQSLPASIRGERIKRFSGKMETSAFKGKLAFGEDATVSKKPIEYHAHSRLTGREISRNDYLKMVYLAPSDHIFGGDVFGSIIRDDIYKEICINILQQFDRGIVDILYRTDENTGRPVEYIKHAVLGSMPLSTYGDGIKKVLSLANGIARSVNGVLLIDELETAIHSKYYDDIFRFLVKACKQFQVQTFITTHSIEAIDGLLATQDYDKNDADDICVITLKKSADGLRTFSRTLTGRHVHANRDEFGFEVRL